MYSRKQSALEFIWHDLYLGEEGTAPLKNVGSLHSVTNQRPLSTEFMKIKTTE